MLVMMPLSRLQHCDGRQAVGNRPRECCTSSCPTPHSRNRGSGYGVQNPRYSCSPEAVVGKVRRCPSAAARCRRNPYPSISRRRLVHRRRRSLETNRFNHPSIHLAMPCHAMPSTIKSSPHSHPDSVSPQADSTSSTAPYHSALPGPAKGPDEPATQPLQQ